MSKRNGKPKFEALSIDDNNKSEYRDDPDVVEDEDEETAAESDVVVDDDVGVRPVNVEREMDLANFRIDEDRRNRRRRNRNLALALALLAVLLAATLGTIARSSSRSSSSPDSSSSHLSSAHKAHGGGRPTGGRSPGKHGPNRNKPNKPPRGKFSAEEKKIIADKFAEIRNNDEMTKKEKMQAMKKVKQELLTGHAGIRDGVPIVGWARPNAVAAAAAAAGVNGTAPAHEKEELRPVFHDYTVLKEIDHDVKSFTQGLSYHDGILYESTGLYGHSKVRRIDAETGEVLSSVDMGKQFFGEGMTFYGDNSLIQLTWKKKRGFVYDADTLETVSNFTYETSTTEGWGITYDEPNDRFVVTDGSDKLHFWDRETLRETSRVKVIYPRGHPDAGRRAKNLNEVEMWRGHVLANEWHTDRIHRIDAKTGVVLETIDFSALWPKLERGWNNDVFNGVATTDRENELYVTGKKWPKIYRIRLDPRETP